MRIKAKQRGITLIETMVAILILAVGVLGSVGLQAKAANSISNSSSRVEAVLATENLIGIIWNNQSSAKDYDNSEGAIKNDNLKKWIADLSKAIPGCTAKVIITPSLTAAGTKRNKVDITINWKHKVNDDLNTHHIIAFLESSR